MHPDILPNGQTRHYDFRCKVCHDVAAVRERWDYYCGDCFLERSRALAGEEAVPVRRGESGELLTLSS
jgi:hypothetical protein